MYVRRPDFTPSQETICEIANAMVRAAGEEMPEHSEWMTWNDIASLHATVMARYSEALGRICHEAGLSRSQMTKQMNEMFKNCRLEANRGYYLEEKHPS